MAKSVLSSPHFQNEKAAFAYVESKLWPNGATCPHCGNCDANRIGKLNGKTTRLGLHKCYECKKPFTVRQGTIFESSHLPLHLWLQIIHLMCASKKGISANQIQRMLSCSMKTAWFLSHRIRAAMTTGTLPPLGGQGKTVEADEMFIGRLEGIEKGVKGNGTMNTVVTLVERGGAARSFHTVGHRRSDVTNVLSANVDKETNLMTDEANHYKAIGTTFASHETVNHSRKEYARGIVSTNIVEGFFSVFKRGMYGTYQHCSEQHLHRYLAEFDFRYSNRMALGTDDVTRAIVALEGVKGKRLTYKAVAGL